MQNNTASRLHCTAHSIRDSRVELMQRG